jgi:hypothetical protein
LIFIVLGALNFHALQAQDSLLHIYIEDSTVVLGDQLCMSVRVNHFDSIEAFQLSINFDPYLLDFDSLGGLNDSLGLNASFFGLQETHLGIVRLTYFNPIEHQSLADSSILFDLCFTAYGLPGELCPVNLADYPLPLEFISGEQEIDFTRQNASVDIRGGDSLTVLMSTCKTGLDDSTGSLSVSVYGGNPPYFVIWQHTFNSDFSGGFGLDTFGDTKVIENLIEGRYRVSITDEDGIRVRDSLNLRKANDLFYSTELIHPTCDNKPEGAIILDSIQGGIVPAQFKWSDGRLFSAERYGLLVGDYYLTITDPLGCRLLDTFVLEANSIQTTILAQDESCLDAGDGRFEVEISGGNPDSSLGYQLLYNMDTSYAFSFSDSLLAAATYRLQIMDSIGCIKNVEAIIGTGFSFGVNELVVDHVHCFGDSSASIFLSTSTLTGQETLPYSFAWTGSDSVFTDSTSILMYNLPIGVYSITVSNESVLGCQWDTSITIVQPSLLNVETANIVPASCAPDGDGEATLNIFGGSPDGDGNYFILWDSGQDSITGTELQSGLHTALVIDLEGCQVIHEVEIPNTEPPTLIGASIRDMRCDSLPIGSILTVFSSPFGIDQYAWSTGGTSSSIDSLVPGLYTCIVQDRNGCLDTFDFAAEVPEGPVISDLIVQNIRCFGDSNGRMDVIYDLGAGLLDRIEWNGVNGGDSLINLRSGGYEVIIYDENACKDSAASTLVDPEPLDLMFDIMDDFDNQRTGSINALVSGGWYPYAYNWQPDTLPSDSSLIGLLSGEYILTLTDVNGCSIIDTAVVGFISAASEVENIYDISIYPNPVGSQLHVSMHPHSVDADNLKVFDAKGRIVFVIALEAHQSEIVLDLSHLGRGQYILTFEREGQTISAGRFMKQ